MNNIIKKLTDVINIISQGTYVSITDTKLLSLTDSEIITPIGDMIPLLVNKLSVLEDEFIDLDLLRRLISKLSESDSVIGLDHIGYCYKVDSLEKEKQRVAKLVKNSSFHLFQEPSNDDSLWLFIGNLENWQNQVIELVPVEKTNDRWVDYWLPHIQIDIDTNRSGVEIEGIVKTVCSNAIRPFSLAIGNTVYIVRNRLGTIDGVNIMLDLATASRKVEVLRKKVWKQID